MKLFILTRLQMFFSLLYYRNKLLAYVTNHSPILLLILLFSSSVQIHANETSQTEILDIMNNNTSVLNIQTTVIKNKDVRITWSIDKQLLDSGIAETIQIYRNEIYPISNQTVLSSATKIIELPINTTSHTNQNVPSGNYYYAIFITWNLDIDEISNIFKADHNYTIRPATIEEDSKTAMPQEQQHSTQSPNSRQQQQQYPPYYPYYLPPPYTNPYYQQGYQNPPPAYPQYRAPYQNNPYQNNPYQNQNQNRSAPQPPQGQQYSAEFNQSIPIPAAPVRKEPPKAESTRNAEEKALGDILIISYERGNYKRAVKLLYTFWQNRNNTDKIRAKALFYSGLSYYHLKRYDVAVQHFIHPLVSKFFPRNSKEWYKNSIDALE